MGKMSRTKGAVFECLIAGFYRERFGWTENECYRSAPLQAAAGDRAGDITTPMPIWHELGHGKQISPHGKLRQAEEAGPPDMVPISVTRRDRGPIQVTLLTGSLFNIAMGLVGAKAQHGPPVTILWDDWLDLVDQWWTGVRR